MLGYVGTLELEEALFNVQAPAETAQRAVCGQYPVTGYDNWQRVFAQGLAYCPASSGITDFNRYPGVTPAFPVEDLPGLQPHMPLEWRRGGKVATPSKLYLLTAEIVPDILRKLREGACVLPAG